MVVRDDDGGRPSLERRPVHLPGRDCYVHQPSLGDDREPTQHATADIKGKHAQRLGSSCAQDGQVWQEIPRSPYRTRRFDRRLKATSKLRAGQQPAAGGGLEAKPRQLIGAGLQQDAHRRVPDGEGREMPDQVVDEGAVVHRGERRTAAKGGSRVGRGLVTGVARRLRGLSAVFRGGWHDTNLDPAGHGHNTSC